MAYAASSSEQQRAAASSSEQQRAAASLSTLDESYSLAIHHADLWGTQNEKYVWLRQHDFPQANWCAIYPKSPHYLFEPADNELRAEYETAIPIVLAMPNNSTGMKTHRDEFVMPFDQSVLRQRIGDFRNLEISDNALTQKYSLSDTRDWKVKTNRIALATLKNWESFFGDCLFRPFDWRPIFYHETVIELPRKEVLQHMTLGQNLGLVTTRSIEIGRGFEHILVTDCLMQHHTVSLKEVNYLFPLYLYNPPINHDTQLLGEGENGRRANLSPGFVAALGTRLGLSWTSDGSGQRTPSVSDGLELGVSSHSDAKPVADAAGSLGTFGPEDVLCYIYAIFHAPSYRARYSEFLKIDFPRVPLTDDVDLFWKLVQCGRALVGLHLLDDDKTDAVNCVPTDSAQGEIAAGYPKFVDNRVLVNAQSGFDNVAESVWNFHIGGYQVAHKWLKDRRGRVLSDEDAAHYRRVLVALEQTIAQMQAIDEIVESHGGWPLRGSQDAAPLSAEEIKSFFAARDASEVDSRPTKTTQIVGTQISASADSNATTDAEICVPTRHRVLDNEESAEDVSETAPSTQQRVLDVGKNTADVPPHVPTQTIDDYTRDELIEVLLNAMEKRIWHEREEVLIAAARSLGFARVGRRIRTAFASAFNGAIRRGLLEYDGTLVRQP